jgi:hypothetical protein
MAALDMEIGALDEQIGPCPPEMNESAVDLGGVDNRLVDVVLANLRVAPMVGVDEEGSTG